MVEPVWHLDRTMLDSNNFFKVLVKSFLDVLQVKVPEELDTQRCPNCFLSRQILMMSNTASES